MVSLTPSSYRAIFEVETQYKTRADFPHKAEINRNFFVEMELVRKCRVFSSNLVLTSQRSRQEYPLKLGEQIVPIEMTETFVN